MRARRGVALLAVIAALLAVWLWRRHGTRASATTTSEGSAAHAQVDRVAGREAIAGGRRVAGIVTLDGKPIDATVRLVGLGGQQRTTADASGHFAFEHVPVATYLLVAEKPDTEGAARPLDLHDPASVEDLVLVLHACNFVVEGVVRDASSPISHATVAESDDDTPGPAVESGDDGHYRLCVAPGDSELLVRADGYAQAVVRLSVSGHLHRDVELVPEAVIAGRVVRAGDHAPVGGAVVQAMLEDWQQANQAWHAVSDADGTFRITGASPGRIVLTALADHYATVAPMPVIAEVAAPAENVMVVVQPAASVRGVVREAGKPVQGATVRLDSKRGYREVAAPDPITQADGTFEVKDVMPGAYVLTVRAYTLPHEVSVTVTHDDVEGIVLDVERGPSIAGRVTYQGSPVDGALVQAGNGHTTTDAAGQFTLVGLKPGKVHVYAESRRVGAFTPGPEITLEPNDHKTGVEVELDRSGSIAGTIVDQDGAPVADVLVKMSLVRGSDWGEASTADDGTFTVTSLAGGGNYAYEVHANDGSMTTYPPAEFKRGAVIAVRDGSTHVTGVKIRVRVDHLAISGHVTTAAGDPLADIAVDAMVPSQLYMGVRLATAVTDASGAFSLRNLQSGSYTVTARSPHGSQSVQAKAGRSDVTIAIPDGAIVEAITEGFREPPDVLLVSVDEGQVYRSTATDTHFVFRDVPPGKYRIRARGRDGDARADVSVASGGHVTVTLRRVGHGSIAGTFVTAAGAPIASSACMSDSASQQVMTTDANGAFRFDDVPAGRALVVCGDDSRASVDVPADGVVTVKLVATSREAEPKHPAGLTVDEQLGDEVVTAIVPGGMADKAGLHVDDVILTFEGVSVMRFGSYLPQMFEDIPPGNTLTLTYQRGDQTLTAKLVSPSP